MFVLYSTEILAGAVRERVLFVTQHYYNKNGQIHSYTELYFKPPSGIFIAF